MQDSIVRYDLISFKNVKSKYLSDCKFEVELVMDPSFTANPADWVGLFKVGWLQSDERVLAKSISQLNPQNKQSFILKLNVDELPDDETEFYHLCYITSDDKLAGISGIFQFIVDDFEVIENCKLECDDSNSIDMKSVVEVKSLKFQDFPSTVKELENENAILKSQINNLTSEKLSLEQELQTIKQLHSSNINNSIPDNSINHQSTKDPNEFIKNLERTNQDLNERLKELQIENERMKLNICVPSQTQSQTSEDVHIKTPRSFSFMDSYFANNNGEGGMGDYDKNAQMLNNSDIVRPIGFINTFPTNEFNPSQQFPGTCYPQSTWYTNPYANYRPS